MWGRWAMEGGGIGPAVQRFNRRAYGNEPTNGVAARPTPGAAYGGGALPIISAQPVPQTAVQYQGASFTVVASGNGPFSYQWRFKGANVPGATNATLVLSNVQPADAADYLVFVITPATSVASTPATFTAPRVP